MATRSRLVDSLTAATERGIPHINSIRKSDDGFVCTFSHDLLSNLPDGFQICLLPQEGTFLAYTDADVPPTMAKALEETMVKANGLSICHMLEDLSLRLLASLTDIKESDITDQESSDSSDWDGDTFDDGDGLGMDDASEFFGPAPRAPRTGTDEPQIYTLTDAAVLSRISRDLGQARKSGFKATTIRIFDEPTNNDIVCLSVRVDKLCLSDETRLAWNLDCADYVVLLIRYTDGGYTSFEDFVDEDVRRPAEFRLRKCSESKPTTRQSLAAFSQGKKRNLDSHPPDPSEEQGAPLFSTLHLGRSIDRMMDEDFCAMLKAKCHNNSSWDAAIADVQERKRDAFGLSAPDSTPIDGSKGKSSLPTDEEVLPSFLTADHAFSEQEKSLPLVAALCAFRYFVRCVDYCMVCREKSAGNQEALKPYICDKSLCLFQYMNLGFGPSVEQEILSQPLVVDLLISLCYASLKPEPRMRQFPTGLSLRVPDIQSKYIPRSERVDTKLVQGQLRAPGPSGRILTDSAVLTNPALVTIQSTLESTCVREVGGSLMARGLVLGNWVVIATFPGDEISDKINAVETGEIFHHGYIHKFHEGGWHINIVSSHKMPSGTQLLPNQGITAEEKFAYLIPYSKNLDDLSQEHKPFSMALLLTTLPSVAIMQQIISDSHNGQLNSPDRIVSSAWSLLKWIISSNRSCIVQLDSMPLVQGNKHTAEKKSEELERQKLRGVGGLIQFRFAQGSPDRELRFQDAIDKVQKPCRTIAAWHGSNMGNWHSIIREGLDYAKVESGRSYGDGVYFASAYHYSRGYAYADKTGDGIWPGSILKPKSIVSLAEIVNEPDKFRSKNPHFVVQHCDWIQCRYLVVDTSGTSRGVHGKQIAEVTGSVPPPLAPSEEFAQDDRHIAQGIHWKLSIPKIAMSFAKDAVTVPSSIQKNNARGHAEYSDDESDNKDQDPATSKTAFTPNFLDLSNLRVLEAHSYATKSSQRALSKEIQNLEKIQAETPPHKLGWYINFGQMENMFQWIVELHSFDRELPLAHDLQELGVQSIVLEMRFGRDYPFTPPFVRVVRPRFLPFMQGGGGHITAGGAMCMELLTNSGWSPANSLESVLLQVRLAICNGDPPGKVDSRPGVQRDYGALEAFEAYERAASAHGWEIPGDIKEAAGIS